MKDILKILLQMALVAVAAFAFVAIVLPFKADATDGDCLWRAEGRGRCGAAVRRAK